MMKKTTSVNLLTRLKRAGSLTLGVVALGLTNGFAQTTFNYVAPSLQTYTVPVGVTSINIDASGAQGGSVSTSCTGTGGLGARIVGDFTVTPGEVLSIMVGQQGYSNGSDAGGGGGSFVVRTGNVCLVAAGGGGGATNNITQCGSNLNGLDATITTSGTASGNGLVAGGTNGNGGGASTGSGGGGGGFLTDGIAGTGFANNNGKCYINGGAGGSGNNNDGGGYGGGGAGWFTGGNGGGGGGYSGGGTSGSQPYSGGGGGGSYNGGTNQVNTAGFQTGNGRVIITVNFAATITQSAMVLCNGQTNGALTANPVGGAAPFTYSWSSGGTAQTETGLGAGTYTCTITDANSLVASQTFTITEPTALVTTSSQNNITCNGGNNGDATAMVSGGTSPYSYTWSSGGTAATETGLAAGTYFCSIVDANGCSSSASVVITEPTAIAITASQTNVNCNGGSDGTATASPSGGTTPYTFVWSNSATTATTIGLAAGTYSCTVTDNNGCTMSQTVIVTEPAAIAAMMTTTDVSCNGGNNGDATATVSGGTSPYTYAWSSGGTAATEMGLVAGTYTCDITDANGCTSSSSVTVNEPTVMAVAATSTSVLCNGGTADVTVTATGGTSPYSGDGMFTVNAGTYNYVVTDNNGCMDSASVTITEPTALDVSVTTSNGPTTCSGTDGMIDITVTGATPGYSYLWSNSATTEDVSGLAAGTYSVTVTDTNGCTSTVNATLADPNPPTVTLALTVSSVCADDASVTLSGGSPAGGVYSGTAVTAGVFDPSTNVLGANTITYTYTDPNTGCSATSTGTITVNACTGIANSVNNESSFLVMPNPNNGTFSLQLNSAKAADVMIYDALGQLISSEKVQPGVMQEMNISTPGIYLITVVTADGQRSTQRVIVNK